MKILCVVTGEALIDGRGVGAGRGRGGCRAVQDMMVEVPPVLANKTISASMIFIRQVLFTSQWLTVYFHSHKRLLVCARQAHSLLFVCVPPEGLKWKGTRRAV